MGSCLLIIYALCSNFSFCSTFALNILLKIVIKSSVNNFAHQSQKFQTLHLQICTMLRRVVSFRSTYVFFFFCYKELKRLHLFHQTNINMTNMWKMCLRLCRLVGEFRFSHLVAAAGVISHWTFSRFSRQAINKTRTHSSSELGRHWMEEWGKGGWSRQSTASLSGGKAL